MEKDSRSAAEYSTNSPEELLSAKEEGREPRHQSSLTGVAEDAARDGVMDQTWPNQFSEVPGDAVLRAGDPDVALLDNEYIGEDIPGGSTPTPDQNNVDAIGRAYGMTEQSSGQLISVEDVLAKRDRKRWELDPRSKDEVN